MFWKTKCLGQGALLAAFLIGWLAAPAAPARGAQGQDSNALRVCSDPNNLPFSNHAGQGFENRIAELMAKAWGVPLEYTWFPQRMGFVRNTLQKWDPQTRRFACDLIMGVTPGFELALTTRPYYHSVYTLVYLSGHGFDQIRSQDDLLKLPEDAKHRLRIGVFGPSPAVDWLLRNGLIKQAVTYPIQTGDPDWYPGQVIQKDLVQGKIDMAILWGPIAGYFVNQLQPEKAVLVPMKSQPGILFDYQISMGVRYSDKALKQKIEAFISSHHDQIQKVLEAYHVPLVGDDGKVILAH